MRVYSGEKPHVTNKRSVVERPGKWYALYLAALITSGGRLLFGMLARCVEGWGGSYGVRELVRQGFGRRFIEKINRLELVKASRYSDYEGRIEEYAQTTTNKEFGLIRAFGVGFFVNDEPASVL